MDDNVRTITYTDRIEKITRDFLIEACNLIDDRILEENNSEFVGAHKISEVIATVSSSLVNTYFPGESVEKFTKDMVIPKLRHGPVSQTVLDKRDRKR